MARKISGPRQPLSQARPGKSASKPTANPPGRATSTRGARASAKIPKTAARALRPPPTAYRSSPSEIYTRLTSAHPDAHCELDYETPLQLLVATILSAQCTDKRVNMVSPALFRRFPTARALADAPLAEVEELVKSTGFFRNKAKNIVAMAGALVERHGGEVPCDMAALVALPGVGRKTANVILGNAFGVNEGIVVDTHVGRLAGRLGLTAETDPVKVEQALVPLFPREQWAMLAHLLIFHGRRVCDAKRPRCGECTLAELCPSAALGG